MTPADELGTITRELVRRELAQLDVELARRAAWEALRNQVLLDRENDFETGLFTAALHATVEKDGRNFRR